MQTGCRRRSRALGERLGPVEVLKYSPLPAPESMKPILETRSTTCAARWSSAPWAPSRCHHRDRPDARARVGDDPLPTGGAAVKPYRCTPVSASPLRAKWPSHGCSTTRSPTVACTSRTPSSGAAWRPVPTMSPMRSPTCSGANTSSARRFRRGSASTEGDPVSTPFAGTLTSVAGALMWKRSGTASRERWPDPCVPR